MVRLWPVLWGLALAVALSASATSSSRRVAAVSVTLVDEGTVLTGPQVGLPPPGVGSPAAVALPDGRIRLYFETSNGGAPGTAGGPPGVYSAISGDGIHFTPEPGRRFSCRCETQVARLPDGRWRLYFNTYNFGSPAAVGIGSAISSDGLSFTEEPGLRLPNPVSSAKGLSFSGIVQLPDGRYRIYVAVRAAGGPGSPPTQIFSAISSDLLGWTLEPGVRLTVAFGGAHPAALLNPDGSTLLSFSNCIPCSIYTAASVDGLTFGAPVNVNGPDSGDESIVTRPDGTLVLYYDTYNPDTNTGSIGAALVTRITAPTVSYPTPATSGITATSATVSAIVNPENADTSYSFEYGTTTSYGNASGSTTLFAGSTDRNVSSTLTGLAPATTYHFRVSAHNQAGETTGPDETFTTAAAPVCRPADRDRGWEVALAHAGTRVAARALLAHARKLVAGPASVEPDSCTDYELALTGLRSERAAARLRSRARAAGYHASAVERT